MRDAADSLTPVTLELGGKDPFIVCDDVDVAQVAPVAMRAAFQSCGQNCVAAERFIVQGGVYDALVERCGAAARALRQGNPLGTPPSSVTTKGCDHKTLNNTPFGTPPSACVCVCCTRATTLVPPKFAGLPPLHALR